MKNFIMKALTADGQRWHVFTLDDAPVIVKDNIMALMNIPNSPMLRYDTIRRGDRDNLVFEGDIYNHAGCDWLVCYERGFYAINEDYVTTAVTVFSPDEFLGQKGYGVDINIRLTCSKNVVLKYDDFVFQLCNICGVYDGNLLVRSHGEAIPPADVQQDSGYVLEKHKVFLEDAMPNGGHLSLLNGDLIEYFPDGKYNVIECLRRRNGHY